MNKIKLIAEIGWNHLGDMKLAKKMIHEAAKSGADICKFQTWSEKNLRSGPWDHDGRREIYKKAQLTAKDHFILKKECKKNNLEFCTSIFSLKDLPFLKKLNKKIIKIPSHEVHNLKLIKKCVRNFNLVLISLGAAKWSEVLKIAKIKSKKIVLMHCVSSYPLAAKNVNFNKFDKISKLSNNQIGYSGHYHGFEDAMFAFSKGATFVEKHFTINNSLPGRDNKFALNPKQFKTLSEFRDLFLKMYKVKHTDLQKCELDIFKNYRGRWGK